MTYVAEGHLSIEGIAGIHQEDGFTGFHRVDCSFNSSNLTGTELLWAGDIPKVSLGGKEDSLGRLGVLQILMGEL